MKTIASQMSCGGKSCSFSCGMGQTLSEFKPVARSEGEQNDEGHDEAEQSGGFGERKTQ